MARYLYLLDPTRPEMLTAGPTPHELATFALHDAYLQRMAGEGTLLMAARALGAAGGFGMGLVVAADDDAARAIAAADPMVTEGVATARVYPFHLAYLAPAFAAEASAGA